MLFKLGLADIEPDSCHLDGSATGPKNGAKLLLLGAMTAGVRVQLLETRLFAVKDALAVTFDVLEDALCNWQKSPMKYVFFAG